MTTKPSVVREALRTVPPINANVWEINAASQAFFDARDKERETDYADPDPE